jgi:hypothetical protein
MDHGNFTSTVSQDEVRKENAEFNQYVEEDGKKFRVPYRIIKKATFSNVSRKELIDIPHAARLQYRLMLLDPILKARVDFTRGRIIVLYNPKSSDNNKEKMSLDELVEILASQGVHIDRNGIEDIDYDYYHDFYSYAYQPSTIREHPPYAYSEDEWKAMKPEWEANKAKNEVEKLQKFRAYQQQYLIDHPEAASKIVEGWTPPPELQKTSLLGKIFGKKKGAKSDKGFWFHGI